MSLRLGLRNIGVLDVLRGGGDLGLPPFLFDPDLVAFTPGMDKRATGVFAAAPICQGDWDGAGVGDRITFPPGDLIGNAAERRYANLDPYQGTVVFWITPEWDGTVTYRRAILGNGAVIVFAEGALLTIGLYDDGGWKGGGAVNIAGWVAGTTYCVIMSWAFHGTIDGTNNIRISVNNVHTYDSSAATSGVPGVPSTMSMGRDDCNAILEGFTIFRRVLVDSNGYGVRPMNGNQYSDDELGNIYAAGAGRDPTLVTGSEDVVFCLPTNATAEELVTGAGEAWSWPADSNLPDVHGMWDGGLPGTDRAVEFNGTSTDITCGSNAAIDNIPSGAHITIDFWVRMDADPSGDQSILAQKGNLGADGWALYYDKTTNQFVFQVEAATAAEAVSETYTPDGKWHLVTGYYNDTTKVARVAVDGRWGATDTGAGAYQADAARDLYVGRYVTAGAGYLNGAVAWWELWNTDHHAGAVGTDFIPPRIPQTPPVAGLVETWWADEGTGVTVAARVTAGAPPGGCNGTIANGSWSSIWEQDATPVVPYSVEFFEENDGIDFGSGANIDNLPSADCTIELYARLPSDIAEGVDLLSKTSITRSIGWSVHTDAVTDRVRGLFRFDTTSVSADFGNTYDGRWHHYALDWDQGTLTLRAFVDGILVDTRVAVGNYQADAAEDCLANARGAIGTGDGVWAVGPIRLSNNRRYTGNNFVPPPRTNWPANDANAHLITLMRDGAGVTVTDYSGNAYHGTITFGATTRWNTTPDMAIDEPGARIYNGGYNLGVDAALEGTYIEQVVVAETDYVVFPVLSIGESGRARPRIRIRDVTGAADIVTFNGPMLYGIHSGANNQATLQPTLPRWIADALIGATVYNITDGSKAVVTDNSETVVTGGLAGGTDNDWDTNDVFVIRFDEGYARTPWMESFCFQAPVACVLLRVFVENINAEGVMAIHQMQVLENLLINGDHESLTGANPDLITGWANTLLDAGDTQASSGGGAIIHSDAEAMQWNVGAIAGEFMYQNNVATGADVFVAMGMWLYGDGTVGLEFGSSTGVTQAALQATVNARGIIGSALAQWNILAGVWRTISANPDIAIHAISGAAGSRYSDDVFAVALDAVSLTVTPASAVNSVETTGLRIDGRDDAQQQILPGYWTSTFGWAMWDWTPRHDDADAVAFGNATPHIFWASAPVANYIWCRWSAANTLQVEVNDGAASNAVWNTGGGVILTGNTYRMMLLYTGTDVFLYVDGILRVTVTPAGGFDFLADVPTTMWWGAEPTPSLLGDATFAKP